MSKIHTFLVQARERGLDESHIINKLVTSGWSEKDAKDMVAGSDLIAPTPEEAEAADTLSPVHPPVAVTTSTTVEKPVAVVQRYTTRGLEYGIQFLALGIGAISLGILLHDLANKALDPQYDSAAWVAMAGAAALVAIPIFVILFMRLKRAEKITPELRYDSSRRKWVQLSLLVSFVWGIWTIIQYLYGLLMGNQSSSNYCSPYMDGSCDIVFTDTAYMTLQLLHMGITLLIAGGIFAYYWIDEHRKDMV